MRLSSLFHQREGKILSLAIVLIITICFLSPMFSLKDYNSLLDADTLKIYSNDKLITTVDNPAYMMDTFDDNIEGTYLTDTSKLGINRRSMSELYRLEFLKDGKVISSIKILTPKTQKDIDNINENFGTEWREFDDHFAIMSENFQYFSICAVAIHIKNEKLHNKPLSAQRVIVACYMSEKPLRRLDIFIIYLVFLHVLCYYVG